MEFRPPSKSSIVVLLTMKSFIVSSILVTLLSTVLVTAVPIPVDEGDIVAVKPSDLVSTIRYFTELKILMIFNYLQEGNKVSSTLRHQAVVVQKPDANDKIKVAVTSSNLDSTVHPKQGDANYYHPDLKSGHVINTGEPNSVHVSHAPASQKITTPVAADKLAELKKEISVYRSLQYSPIETKEFSDNNCGAGLTRRDGRYLP